jgi:Tol biopolymer transport system component
MSKPTANPRMAIILLISLTLILSILPDHVLAAQFDDYMAKYTGSNVIPLQRTLDAYGKGPFCAGCHSLPYPLPPETMIPQRERLVGSTEMEPGLKRLTCNSGRNVGAVYSPKADKIIWVTDSLGRWTIWIMDGDGRNKKQLTSNDVISGWPSWSPDGQEITYWAYDPASKTADIWKMKVDGSSRTRITTDGSFKGPPMWSPRGDRISYTANQTGNMEVYVINTDGGGQKQLTTGHNPGYSLETRTTWNPDGVRLYYQALTFPLPPYTVTTISGDVAFVEIFMVNVDTGKESNLTPKLHENVRSVSSDGEKMACISLRSPNYGLWTMNADGTNQTRLTWDGKGDRAPRFSLDGKKIVYWSLASGYPNIWMINADGSNRTQLTSSSYQDAYPSWSPNGEKIIFESDRADRFDIWQLSLNDPISVNVEFEKCAVPGSTGKVSLTINPRNIRDTLKIEKVGLHFDWNSEDRYVENVSSLPILTKPDGVAQVILEFSVPKNAELGYHFYDVRVQYSVENQAEGRSGIYEHTTRDLKVGPLQESDCQDLYVHLGSELDQRYESAMNRSIALGAATSEVAMPLKGYFDYLLTRDGEKFQKANEEYYEAKYLYLAGDFDAALPRLQKVRTLLSEPTSETTTAMVSLSSWVSVALLSAVTIVVILLLVKSKKKRLPTE